MIVPVPDGLYPRNISQTVPGRGLPGPETQLGPLYSTSLYEGGGEKGAYGLPTQSAPLPLLDHPSQTCVCVRQAISRSQKLDPQSPPA